MAKQLFIFLSLIFLSTPAWSQMNNPPHYQYNYISTSGTTVVKTGPGILHGLLVTGGSAGTITIYDNAFTSAPTVSKFSSTAALAYYPFDTMFSSGCTVSTSGQPTGLATNMTVLYL